MSDEQENQNQGSANAEQGSASSAVKNDVSPETHFADEKGVPYYNRYRELESKFKDVDLDRYGRLKDFDPDDVEEAVKFRDFVYADEKKLNKVLEILKGQAADAIDPTKSQANQSPEVKALLERIEKTEQRLQQYEQKETKLAQAKWMEEFDSSVSRSIEDALKAEELKDLGGKLSEFEKKAIVKFVDDAFEADSKNKPQKLSIKSVPQVVQGIMKMVLDHRKGNLGGMLKRDTSPEAIRGNGNTGTPKQKPMTDEERIEAMKNFVKESDAGKIPV